MKRKYVVGNHAIPRKEKDLDPVIFNIEPKSGILDGKTPKRFFVIEGVKRGQGYDYFFPNRVNLVEDFSSLDHVGIERRLYGTVNIKRIGGVFVVQYDSSISTFDGDVNKNYDKRTNYVRDTRVMKSFVTGLQSNINIQHFVMKFGDLEKTSEQIARLLASGKPGLVERL